jgi:hypothetical protein
MSRRGFRRLGATGVTFPGLEDPYQVTEIPQGLFAILVDNDALDFLLLGVRKGNNIRHEFLLISVSVNKR